MTDSSSPSAPPAFQPCNVQSHGELHAQNVQLASFLQTIYTRLTDLGFDSFPDAVDALLAQEREIAFLRERLRALGEDPAFDDAEGDEEDDGSNNAGSGGAESDGSADKPMSSS